MRVEIVTIGDELLLGFTVDTNGAHIARELAAVGVEVVRRTSVGDEASEIAGAVRDALERTGAVITTGGLGPTADDMTKPSIARLFGRELHVDETLLAQLAERWRKRFGTELPASNRQQVAIPDGARVLTNRHGSAPGIWLEDERRRWVAMLPGVPREMRGMLADELLPLVRERAAMPNESPRVVRSRTVRTTAIAESAIADRLGEIARGVDGLALAYLPGPDGVDLRLTSRGLDATAADAALTHGAERLRERVGRHAYGEDAADLAAVVLDACRAAGLTIAVAESCTGGLLGARLTAIAGSSDVVVGGVIAYSNDVKVRQLGVDPDALAEHGAVSEAVVRQMARGVRERLGASIGVGITGVAGPGGGSPEKPVGTVWLAVDLAGAEPAVHRGAFIGDRAEIRYRAAQHALEMVRRLVAGASRPR
ncbi:Competence-damaged protein [Gemmatirosa kalamazoonensis]|uniref:CinA-like protein n=1 Tax=Gemmatirosa kalamazoonensis TaxID=861299 RepID=W0RJB6_9BACT|nr:competence/damage-inducible protein A [Gemmatirosa kalamazoonensis]AHG90425.1 Competence-damaged protein [Gemmatirosa kalamazoonensis]